MNAIILDTETHDMNGYPIEISYSPCAFVDGALKVGHELNFDEFFSCPEPINLGAMAVHHILESDIAGKPSFETFRLPAGVEFMIGHNVDYDVKAVQKCDPKIEVKAICTMALSRMLWPDASHSLGALFYQITEDKEKARKLLRNAHSAKWDIYFTGKLLEVLVAELGIKDMNSLYMMSETARIPKKITFGKHKGTDVKDLPSDYKAWLLRQDDVDPYLRKALKG